MLCANANLFRDGKICHDCMGKAFPLGAAIHGCYSKSHVGSALVSAAYSYHRFAHTWDGVSLFIALTQFQRGLLIRGGLDPTRIIVKPNFLRETGRTGEGKGGYALFVGRLTPEKGIRTVLDAWEQNKVSLPLKIMGDGPLADEVRRRAVRRADVEYLGHQPSTEVYDAMANARFLVFPSECYEAFGLTIVEAFSRGTPVLAADSESIAELVKDGHTGLRFRPGDSDDLAAKAALISADTATYQAMRRQCRKSYEERYTEERNYKMLIDIYDLAIQSSSPQPATKEYELNYLHHHSVLDREVS
jgi:glycosyltransferase involved in cell wall biosynthesis